MSAIQAIQAPMRMKDLIAEHRSTYKALRGRYVELEFHFNKARYAFRTAYHTEMTTLAKKQAEEKAALREQATTEKALRQQAKLELRQQAKAEKAAIRQQAKAEKAAIYHQVKEALRQQAKEDKAAQKAAQKAEKDALLEQAKAARHKKAMEEKALREQAKAEPDFWTDHPNYGGRRHTMTLVLKSLNVPVMPAEQMDKLMIAYAEWLLTVENGRKCRWSLMTAFVTERIVV
jgi:hypothetical protein